MFLYNLSNSLMGLLIVGACAAAVVGTYLLLRPRLGRDFTDAQVGTAMAFVGVMATMTSLLLAFSSVSVWEAYNAAESSVVDEANEAAELVRDLAVYGPAAAPTRTAVAEYLRMTVEDEWPLLARGESTLGAWQELDEIFRKAGKIEPRTPREQVMLGEIWARINGLTKARRNRMHASQAEVPGILWAVVLASTALG